MQEIINAIEARKEELAIRLIRESGFDFSRKLPPLEPGDCPPPTPLHYAAKHGLIKVIRCLVEHGSDIDAHATWLEHDHPLDTPTRAAISFNQLETLKELWKNGHPWSIKNSLQEQGFMLTIAAKYGYFEMVKWLIEQKFPVDGHEEADVPVTYAFWGEYYDIAEYLLEKGASIDDEKFQPEHNPIDVPGFMDFLKNLLIKKKGFKFSNKSLVIAIDAFEAEEEVRDLVARGYDLERVDHKGINLIQAAILGQNLSLIEVLLNIGVDIDKTDSKGFHTLDYVLCSQNEELIHLFQSKGFKILERQIQGNKHGLWAVIQGNSAYIFDAIIQGGEKAIQTMQKEGLDLNCQTDKSLDTPMHYAAYRNHADVVQLLIKFGADVNVINAKDSTPLSDAAEQGHANIVDILIDAGALVRENLLSHFYRYISPTLSNKLEIAFKLLKAGAPINKSDFWNIVQDFMPAIWDPDFPNDLSESIGVLMNISTACFKYDRNEPLKAGVRENLHKYYLKQGYDKVAKELEKIVKNKNSQIKDSLEKHKEAIKLFASIEEFERIAGYLGEEEKIKFKQDLQASKDIICDMPFSYIQSKIYPQQHLLSKISSFEEPKKQIVFLKICKDGPIFSQLQDLNHEVQPEPQVQKTGEDENVPMVDDIP